jgi:proteasome lid subunit RPN8/RPN11
MLSLSQQDFEALRAHGEETYPHECCGVLLGSADDDNIRVSEAVRAGNTRTDAAHNRYHIAPVELVHIQRTARGKGLDIVGFYHSHPDAPAQWSQTDFAEAHWFCCAYVITSVDNGKANITNAWILRGDGEEAKRFEMIEVVRQP